jgi:NAD(P)-dependent dehydrogenase (short-subunit alcohol dehydrogenase family)
VVVAARRREALQALVEEAGGGTAVPVDLCEPESCAAFAVAAAEAAGGPIDAVLFTAGTAPLARIETLDAEQWHRTLSTNVVALNLIISGLLPSLARGAVVAALSSEAVGMPRFGLAAYGASKTALEYSLRSWRLEHPEVRFSVVNVGSTVPTEFGDQFDPELLVEALNVWATQGLAQAAFMKTDDLGCALVELVATALRHPEIGMEHVALRSPSGVVATADHMVDVATALR